MTQTPDIVLARLLSDLFAPDEAANFLRRLENSQDLYQHIVRPDTVAPASYFDAASAALIRRGLVDEGFFQQLLDLRPKCRTRILAAAASLTVTLVLDTAEWTDLRPWWPHSKFKTYCIAKQAHQGRGHTLGAEARAELAELRRNLRSGHVPKYTIVDDRYVLMAKIGHGGFGSVWKARDDDTKDIVAVKILHDHLLNDLTYWGRFRRGAEKMASLQHPSIMRVLDGPRFTRECSLYYYVMPFVDGWNLRDAILQRHIQREDGLRLVLAIGRALEYAHASEPRVVHRDVKPENIVIPCAEPSSAILTDFDLVWADDTVGGTTSAIGSGMFMAPEMTRFDTLPAEPRPLVDVYSLGMVAAFVTDPAPFMSGDRLSSDELLARLHCHDTLRSLLARAVHRIAEMRCPSLGAFCDDLERCLWGSAPSPSSRPRFLGWARIPAGRFTMGSHDSDRESQANERPQHEVEISRPFLLRITPVTQLEWQGVMKCNPSFHWNHPGSYRRPVERVTWYDAIAYCNALSDIEGLEPAYNLIRKGDEIVDVAWKGFDCPGYRLPTEAEWEYACRAGRDHVRHGELANIAWSRENSQGESQQGYGLRRALRRGPLPSRTEGPPAGQPQSPSGTRNHHHQRHWRRRRPDRRHRARGQRAVDVRFQPERRSQARASPGRR